MKLSAKQCVLRALQSHENVSTRQVLQRARVKNVSARVAELRYEDGYSIYTNSRYSRKLGKRYFYRLGETKVKKTASR